MARNAQTFKEHPVKGAARPILLGVFGARGARLLPQQLGRRRNFKPFRAAALVSGAELGTPLGRGSRPTSKA